VRRLILAVVLAGAGLARAEDAAPESPPATPASPGGALTRVADNRNAFALPAPSLSARELRDFNFGNRLFNTNWVAAPASVEAFDGLGPTFNRVSCSGCHVRDGRGRPPIEGREGIAVDAAAPERAGSQRARRAKSASGLWRPAQ
jgi:CxxC motif-containing protein (DUF1111 family)